MLSNSAIWKGNLLGVVLVLFFLCGSVFPVSADLVGQTVATVTLTKTEGISSVQLDQRVAQVAAARKKAGLSADGVDRKEVLDAMIAEVLIKQAAERSGISIPQEQIQQVVAKQKASIEQQVGRPLTDSQYQEVVRSQTGLSWEQYTGNIREQIMQQRYIATEKRDMFEAIQPPTEKEIQDHYDAHATSITNPEYVRLKQIFIPTISMNDQEKQAARERLESAWTKLRNGSAKFDDLVLQYSEDESSKYRGGDVGYIARTDQRVEKTYGADFFRKLFSLQTGDYSGVIESNVGLHILKVTEHREARILSLDDQIAPDNKMTVREYIRAGLFQEKQQVVLKKALDAVVEDLKAEAEIVVY
ncbi:peptidylprolyl isomerase [Sediminispirochaeta bajacaliforniensis]|uniref:peptidylprolyl isomerase n=1 Tax=Sediminispirochaeta bajacaliforniensis TaxID=148 RepID=UPI0003AB1519|nr:peptidylprolyl isomerase [Sediminispirochaeta bajacaliforniensis]